MLWTLDHLLLVTLAAVVGAVCLTATIFLLVTRHYPHDGTRSAAATASVSIVVTVLFGANPVKLAEIPAFAPLVHCPGFLRHPDGNCRSLHNRRDGGRCKRKPSSEATLKKASTMFSMRIEPAVEQIISSLLQQIVYGMAHLRTGKDWLSLIR